jgi:hypothetical protein
LKQPYKIALATVGLLGVAALVLLLFLQDRQIKLLQGQVAVKVPALLSNEQAAMDYGNRSLKARTLKTMDDALYKLGSVSIVVTLDDAVKKVLSEDRVRNKFVRPPA